MTETPKPPEGYRSWVEYLIEFGVVTNSTNRRVEYKDYARAELAALLAERDTYKAALQRIAAGRTTEDRVAGEDHAYEMCAARLCSIARDALRHKELAK